mmetsp:Transcript_79654/g.221644  ORF Transcript_79654/g.221644 Transcript_79654/m.221644 type:complete len:684 (+) Transcript_79654:35-2086(+)|eukprot:CAMPEP_0117507678 /NCGR_PEP_ID=MMETSP0784-20121206/26549_1 /TAXON_ID=39447 /ORGANISM="" /LENGTH=683 /DNA_ID=CAMNT_0005303193 /DNA_START=42 /DNA_END=2093 /DNA_ORIENTATION=+
MVALSGTPLGSLLGLRASAAEFESVWHEVEEKQGHSIAAKKKLAEETKAFKRLHDAERLASAPDLLKAYQLEIDGLTKRAKFAEAAFEALLRRFRESPDAAAVQAQVDGLAAAAVQAASDQAASVASLETRLYEREAQVKRLSEEVCDLEAELKTVTNQAATVRRLERQVKELEAGTEEAAASARKQKDEEWARLVSELRQELHMSRSQSEEALVQLARQRQIHSGEIERLGLQHLQEQRLAEEAVLARAAEVESLSSDLERLQAELERERLHHAENKESQCSVKVLQSLLDGVQRRAAALERETLDLRQLLTGTEETASKREAAMASEKAALESAVAAKTAEISSLEEQLAIRPSVDEVSDLRQQLQNVKTVEVADAGGATTDLERRLLQKQRALDGQLSEARMRGGELEKEVDQLQQKLRAALDEGQDLKQLVNRLDSQAARSPIAATSAQFATLMPAIGASTTAAAGTPFSTLQGAGDGASYAPPVAMTSPQTTSAPAAIGGPVISESDAPMPSMLEIVTGQRDRLRERASGLEQERDRWRTAAEQERKRGDMLHSDNVRLLERVKYMQSFQPKQGGGGGRGRSRARASEAVDPDLERRYSPAYKDSLTTVGPLEQFREDEKARHLASMNVAERNLVVLGSLLSSSTVARSATLVYLSALHLLVFFVLMKLAHGHNHSLT